MLLLGVHLNHQLIPVEIAPSVERMIGILPPALAHKVIGGLFMFLGRDLFITRDALDLLLVLQVLFGQT